MMLAIQKISRYTALIDHDAFVEDELVIDGVARNLEIIGEAARQLPKNLSAPIHRFRGCRSLDFGTELFTTTSAWILRLSGRSSSATFPS